MELENDRTQNGSANVSGVIEMSKLYLLFFSLKGFFLIACARPDPEGSQMTAAPVESSVEEGIRLNLALPSDLSGEVSMDSEASQRGGFGLVSPGNATPELVYLEVLGTEGIGAAKLELSCVEAPPGFFEWEEIILSRESVFAGKTLFSLESPSVSGTVEHLFERFCQQVRMRFFSSAESGSRTYSQLQELVDNVAVGIRWGIQMDIGKFEPDFGGVSYDDRDLSMWKRCKSYSTSFEERSPFSFPFAPRFYDGEDLRTDVILWSYFSYASGEGLSQPILPIGDEVKATWDAGRFADSDGDAKSLWQVFRLPPPRFQDIMESDAALSVGSLSECEEHGN